MFINPDPPKYLFLGVAWITNHVDCLCVGPFCFFIVNIKKRLPARKLRIIILLHPGIVTFLFLLGETQKQELSSWIYFLEFGSPGILER